MSSEAITRNDLMNILNEVLPSTAVDYVVEQGTSGNWTYRKWNSGILEQWYEGNPGAYTVNTARGNLYSGNEITYTYPVPFIASPSVTSSVTLSTAAYVVWVQETGYWNTGITLRIVSSGSIAQNSNYNLHIQAIGRWK